MKKQFILFMFLISTITTAFPKTDSNDHVMIVIKDYIKSDVKSSDKLEIIWSSPIIKNSDNTWAQAVKLKIKNSDTTPTEYGFIVSEDKSLKIEKMLPVDELKAFQKKNGIKVAKIYNFEGKELSKLKFLSLMIESR